MTAAAPAASPALPQVLLAHHPRQLKLPAFLREYEKLAAEAAREGLDHVHFLLRLAGLELIDRERRMVEAHPRRAFFGGEEFRHVRLRRHSVAQQTADTRTGAARAYLIARDNIIALGNSGTGKTHACLALGLAACQHGFSVAFFTAAELVHQLMCKRLNLSFQSLPREIATCHSSHGGEFGGRINSVKDASRARAGEAGAIARCLQRAFFRTPYGILARINSASPIMLGPCDEWRNLTLTDGSNPNFYRSSEFTEGLPA